MVEKEITYMYNTL